MEQSGDYVVTSSTFSELGNFPSHSFSAYVTVVCTRTYPIQTMTFIMTWWRVFIVSAIQSSDNAACIDLL